MNNSKINKLIKYKLFFLIKEKEKIDLITNKKFNIKIISNLINTLKEESKLDVLRDLFIYENNNNYQKEEIINLFTKLSHHDKLMLLDELDKSDNQEEIYEYLNHLSEKELVDMTIDSNILSESNRIYIIDNLLSKETKTYLFKYAHIYNNQISLAIIKYLDVELLRKSLKRKQGLIRNLTKENYAVALSFLPSVQEKLSLLNEINEYNVELTENQKIKIIMTTNDEERMKIITNTKIEKYKRIEVAKTLTDEGKMYFVENPNEMTKYLNGYEFMFYNSFSPSLTRRIIYSLGTYKINSFYLDDLIKKLEPIEIIEILYTRGHYNIPIQDYQIPSILKSLPEKYKLELIKQKNIYNIELTEEQIIELIQNMNPQNIIKVLIKEKQYSFDDKIIWKIIEKIPSKYATYFLESKEPQILEFCEKYKTSFSKCLDLQDKIDIIYNISKYNIHLEDNKKLKLLKNLDLYCHKDLLGENVFKYFDNPDNIIEKLISDKREFNKLELIIQEHVAEYISKNKDMLSITLNILKYIENSKELLNNFDHFQKLLEKLDINMPDFVQYGINSNKYKWDIIILDIINNNKTNEFVRIKHYFDKYYYNNKEDKKKNIENFLELLNAYHKYEVLCKNLTKEEYVLTKDNKEDIHFLFTIDIKETPTSLEEIQKIRNDLIKSFQEIANNNYNCYELKNALLNLFFGKDVYTMTKILNSTGRAEELKILKFNNRQNQEYCKIIDHVILMTEFIERILNTHDVIGLKETLNRYTEEENLEKVKRYVNYCNKYEEYIRKLYELDIQVSLTNINQLDKKYSETEYAKEMSKKYGGVAYDLTDSKYVLMAHVKSRSESISSLLEGESNGLSNFICMSPSSHRGQHYYSYTEYSVVFAYDKVPNNSFICSSIDNLGSNSCLNYNTSEVPEMSRVQKGILETSEASTHKNAEVLLYREGIKPVGIIIPKGIVPCEEAIKYHQEYNIPFILTQEIDQTIDNPKELNNKRNISFDNEFNDLEIIKELELKEKDKKERRIAIITDPHALYEPTMACLTDIKNKGIEEIYSLGDNIGHGPSPKETLDLLEEYNVKSILGNHELYIIKDDAMEIFKNHLISTGALERTTDMTNWIKEEITNSQFEAIKKYKDRYEFFLSNGDKITLIHTQNPYNKEGLYSNKIEINDSVVIIKGHEHFANEKNDEYTLRAVGIGQTKEDDGLATYAILTIKDAEYFIEICNVPYNRSNLLHTINESSMPVNAKSLIKSWVSKK